ncbi:MAG TPA: hypothetical protein VI389_01785, partial [Geobacteraceae bacterium]
MAEETQSTSLHPWKFFRAGGFDQALLESGEDVVALSSLDQKLWSALSCPVRGVEFDARTLALIDTDGDGHIRVPEILATVEWVGKCLKSPRTIELGEGVLPLDAIDATTAEGARVLASARTVLRILGKEDAAQITVEDSCDSEAIFSRARFNGDGIVTAASTDDEALKDWIGDIIACFGGETDRSGEPGVSGEAVARFSAEAAAWLAWQEESVAPLARSLPHEEREAALAVWQQVKPKIDDYFLRCRLASYDDRAAMVLNASEEELAALAPKNLATCEDEFAAFPLAAVTATGALGLEEGVNPAWSASLAAFRALILVPLHGGGALLTVDEWEGVKTAMLPYETWWAGRVETAV